MRSLVVWSPYVRYLRAPDHPCGLPEALVDQYLSEFAQRVGNGGILDLQAPSWSRDSAKRRWWGRGERLGGAPGFFTAMFDLWLHTDVRSIAESVQAPTLVLGRRCDPDVIHRHAKDAAERIPNARYVEFDGDDSVWFAGDADSVLDEIESFLTGARSAKLSSRVLSTVLFTDIVESTERAAQLGDSAWTRTLAAHDSIVERHRDGLAWRRREVHR